MKKVMTIIGIMLSAILLIMLVIVLFFRSKQLENIEASQNFTVDKKSVVEHLSQSLKYKTISYDDSPCSSGSEFLALHAYLEKSFPLIHKKLKKEVISDYTLFYTWQGKNPDLPPILFSGHLDVVPAEQKTGENWTHLPFDGYIDEKFIWGRGTLDNKGVVICMMEAVEQLIKEGFQPERTICFVFTHDEEIGGINGASSAAKMFDSKGIKFQYILDEGGTITNGILPGISEPVAMIGTAEKGAANIELHVVQTGGTSAVPPEQTAIGILSEAIYKLQKNQFPMRTNGATRQMFEYIGPEMGLLNKCIFANSWFFDGVIKNQLSKSSAGAASLRTTTAATVINGGVKANVIPAEAKAVVNFRIIQGDSVESVIKHVERTINDKRVSIKLTGYSVEPSPVSDVEVGEFKNIHKTVKQIFPHTIVTPYLWTGGTNSKHFTKYADNIYRFSPLLIDKDSMSSVHGTEEKISIDNLLKCVMFYKQLMLNSAQ